MIAARRLLVLILALLLGAQVIRSSAVTALAERNPDLAVRIWPDHPTAEISFGMIEIGKTARRNQQAPPAAFAMMADSARKAPLAPEPFFVRGVQAQLSGNQHEAIQAFSAAAARDPRSLAGHYLLADALLRTGDAGPGLREVGILARLAPAGVASVAPYVTAYAKDRRNWVQLHELFKSNPALEGTVLTALAADASNADMVLELANDRKPGTQWLPTLLNSLVAARKYEKAREIWANAAHVRNAIGQLYDGNFAETAAPAPFNWALMSSGVGLAERGPRGGLHVIYYGREDGLLARQLLLLRAGEYRLSMSSAGNARALTWSVRCDGAQAPIAAVPVKLAGTRPWNFTVPTGCPAQWLELSGVAADVVRQSEVTIRYLQLILERPNG